MNSVIAMESLIATRAGEDPFELKIEIGTPYKVGSDPEEWACPLALSPLYQKLHDAHGGNSFQSLCLAASLALDLLHGFLEKGGSLTFPNGDTFPFEAYSFGAATKRPAGAA
jgi:hypothetical protein